MSKTASLNNFLDTYGKNIFGIALYFYNLIKVWFSDIKYTVLTNSNTHSPSQKHASFTFERLLVYRKSLFLFYGGFLCTFTRNSEKDLSYHMTLTRIGINHVFFRFNL